jgi:hypothetical protein
VKRVLSLVLTGLLVAGVAVAIIAGHGGRAKTPGRLTTVKGIIGSEKQPFLPIRAFAASSRTTGSTSRSTPRDHAR